MNRPLLCTFSVEIRLKVLDELVLILKFRVVSELAHYARAKLVIEAGNAYYARIPNALLLRGAVLERESEAQSMRTKTREMSLVRHVDAHRPPVKWADMLRESQIEWSLHAHTSRRCPVWKRGVPSRRASSDERTFTVHGSLWPRPIPDGESYGTAAITAQMTVALQSCRSSTALNLYVMRSGAAAGRLTQMVVGVRPRCAARCGATVLNDPLRWSPC